MGFLRPCTKKKRVWYKMESWMKGCFSYTNFVISVNGSVKGWANATKSLRQGNQFSSFLFTITANVGSRMLLRVKENGRLGGFLVGGSRTRMSYLQFTNNNIFFLELL